MMRLPDAWIDKIFEKLTVIYGRDFHGRWEGIDPKAVKADWALELAGLLRNPQAIAYALEHLPPARPPTVLEFREIARKAPRQPCTELPAPAVDGIRLKAHLGDLEGLKMKSMSPRDPRAWIQAVERRIEAGEPVSPTVRRFAQEARARVSLDLA